MRPELEAVAHLHQLRDGCTEHREDGDVPVAPEVVLEVAERQELFRTESTPRAAMHEHDRWTAGRLLVQANVSPGRTGQSEAGPDSPSRLVLPWSGPPMVTL